MQQQRFVLRLQLQPLVATATVATATLSANMLTRTVSTTTHSVNMFTLTVATATLSVNMMPLTVEQLQRLVLVLTLMAATLNVDTNGCNCNASC